MCINTLQKGAKDDDDDDDDTNETAVNLDPRTKTEIQLAVTQLKNGKAGGPDNTNPEVLKVDPEITVEMLYPLLEKIRKEEKIPEEWEEGLIIKIPKKRDLSYCKNWTGINLLSTPSKILTRVINIEYKIQWNNISEKNKLDSANTEAALT
jgi:hypothetical protein